MSSDKYDINSIYVLFKNFLYVYVCTCTYCFYFLKILNHTDLFFLDSYKLVANIIIL